MARAPRPGSRAEAEAARQFIRIRVKDRTLDMMPDLTMKERFVVRLATEMPLEAFLPAESQREFGEDTLFVLWWVARRQNGEPNLPFKQAEAEWPKGLSLEDIEIDLIDLDDEPAESDSGEGSGLASSEPGPDSPTSSASDLGSTTSSPSASSNSSSVLSKT